jgi:hypothetical protein
MPPKRKICDINNVSEVEELRREKRIIRNNSLKGYRHILSLSSREGIPREYGGMVENIFDLGCISIHTSSFFQQPEYQELTGNRVLPFRIMSVNCKFYALYFQTEMEQS